MLFCNVGYLSIPICIAKILLGKSSVEVYLWDTSKEEFQRSESAKIEVKWVEIFVIYPRL